MNATTITIHVNISVLEGEALQRWNGILQRALARWPSLEEGFEVATARGAFAQGK